ncbi:hypothetical protein [Fuerstiella marisgermanici]|uniref:Uncharacterized protein n=1 Tax=Fuerstiella marisgermanici TaxID=1891926 RepID=A0A1P8W908_9PLAN|nr:hypothetical protein [Fuerstiella marisgermanici]APZ90534.1 hypothetical protein Fuma_00113 [Fuerstiella marisgermanici]
MASTQEFTEFWQRLSVAELEAIAAVATSPKTSEVSRPMAFFLADALQVEADHREHFKTKTAQLPPVDRWSDSEVSEAYFAATMTERALAGTSERLNEWAALLKACICLEMAARLKVRQIMRDPSCN